MTGPVVRPFRQVDVFSAEPLRGNPVAVVHDAEGLTTEQMQAFAAWTNLSETTFLLAPETTGADYRLRIFTPTEELPFAGHPTLGSAHAWLEAGGVPATPGTLVQECGAGLVTLRQDPRLAFVAPPLVRSGPPTSEERAHVLAALRLAEGDVVAMEWCDNGPGWIGVLLPSAEAVLAVTADHAVFGDLDVGLVGRYDEARSPDVGALVEVRALFRAQGVVEDPVTGSLNASLAQWLTADGTLPSSYVAAQGTLLGRSGRVHVDRDGDTVWVGGETRTIVVGEVALGG